MNPIKIIVAGNNFLFSKGLECLINEHPGFELASIVENESTLAEKIAALNVDVLAIDLSTLELKPALLQQIKTCSPRLNILAFNSIQPRNIVAETLEREITSYLLLCCDKEEITEALFKTHQGERFLCGQVLEVLMNNKNTNIPAPCPLSSVCGGVSISGREMEIVRLVSEGLSNQQIAGKLFLSVHTVNTHRKNIMAKLGINNTAGLVMYAVRSQLVPAHYVEN
jgi:DNA-binding NarL/FixJ family response regulator